MEEKVVRHMMNGNLAWASRAIPQVRSYMEIVRNMDANHPAVYMQLLIDKSTSLSPTPEELHQTIRAMGDYVPPPGDKQTAINIDKAFNSCGWDGQRTQKGLRKYLCLAQHRVNQNSNCNMNLAEAACAVIFPGRFKVWEAVVSRLWQQDQVMIGEITLTCLAQAHITNSGGFNYYPAGYNNDGALHVTSADWLNFTQLMIGRPRFMEIKKVETEKVEEQKSLSSEESRNMII